MAAAITPRSTTYSAIAAPSSSLRSASSSLRTFDTTELPVLFCVLIASIRGLQAVRGINTQAELSSHLLNSEPHPPFVYSFAEMRVSQYTICKGLGPRYTPEARMIVNSLPGE